MPRRWTLLLCAVWILSTGACFHSAAFVERAVDRFDCQSGAFEGRLVLERESGRRADVVFETLPGQVNLDELSVQPARARVSKASPRVELEIHGRVVDSCQAAGLSVMASFTPASATSYLEILPVMGIESFEVRGSEAGGDAVLALRCCGQDVSGEFAIRATGEGAASIAITPATITCADEEVHEVVLRATSSGSVETLQLEIENVYSGATCGYKPPTNP